MSKYTRNIEEKIRTLLKEKYGNDDFKFININEKSNYNKEYLNKFHYIFKTGEGKIFLWNNYIFLDIDYTNLNKEDFNNEELNFFKEMKSVKENNVKKYGFEVCESININKEIETERLILKPFNNELENEYNNYILNNKGVFENYYQMDYVDRCINMIFRPLMFAITSKDNNEFIGSIGFNSKNDCLYYVEYLIKLKYRKRGYAKEALLKLIDKIKSKELKVLLPTCKELIYDEISPDIKCLAITTEQSNISSQALAKSAGFIKTGTLLFETKFKNKYHDLVVYHLVINDDRDVKE